MAKLHNQQQVTNEDICLRFKTKMVTCLTPDGTVIYQHKDAAMRRLCGLCSLYYSDAEDSLFVCNYYKGKVYAITAHGKKNTILLASEDGLHNPQSIAFRPIDVMCVVGCADIENLLIFKLKTIDSSLSSSE